MSHKRINARELLAIKTENTPILDLRTQAEVNAICLDGCLHIPLHELSPERLERELSTAGKKSEVIYLLCQAGKRAEMAAEQLQGHIQAELVIIDGGIAALQQANAQLQRRGGKTPSIERQVRIAAGFLVLLGVLLGTWGNPGFYALAGFVGAGLMFAGITDTCMLGMLIARAPWNR